MESLDNYTQALDRLYNQGLIEAKFSLLTPKPGEILFYAEDSADTIFGVKSGKIQLVRYLENGGIAHQYAIQQDVWFGEDSFSRATYQSCAIASQPSQVIAIPIQIFQTLLFHEPELAFAFISQLSEQLHIAKTFMTLRCIRSAYERVLTYLVMQRTPEQPTFFLETSIKEIAEQICLTPEVVSRSLRKLQDDGVIQRHQRKITFLDS